MRVVLADGGQWPRTPASEVRQIINLCKQLNMIAVLEVHDATGRESVADLRRAVDYWIDIRNELIGQEAYVIINIANEWFGPWNRNAEWRDGYVAQIPRLRAAGLNHTLMIDCAGWGQHPEGIWQHGAAIINADPQRNIMFSIHMYEYAGANVSTVRSNIDRALAVGAPLVIGEFGHQHGSSVGQSTPVAFQEIMSYSQTHGVGYLGWSWKGNGSPVQYLDIVAEWDGRNPSAGWGVPLLAHIRQTSRPASVYPTMTPRAAPFESEPFMPAAPPIVLGVLALLPFKKRICR